MGATTTAIDVRRKTTLRLDVPSYSVANITHALVNAILSDPTETTDKRFVSNYALTGNRTRVTSMAPPPTRPSMGCLHRVFSAPLPARAGTDVHTTRRGHARYLCQCSAEDGGAIFHMWACNRWQTSPRCQVTRHSVRAGATAVVSSTRPLLWEGVDEQTRLSKHSAAGN